VSHLNVTLERLHYRVMLVIYFYLKMVVRPKHVGLELVKLTYGSDVAYTDIKTHHLITEYI
jgi:hypothetical protein